MRLKIIPTTYTDPDNPENEVEGVEFAYRLSADSGCRFSLLSECRDDVANRFRSTIDAKGQTPVVVEIAFAPWHITQLQPKPAANP